IETVRIAGVEGEIVIRIRIHLAGADIVEALGRLTIAFSHLRAEIARPAADRIGLQDRELALAILFPDFELGFFLEDADEDRRVLVHLLLLQRGHHPLGERGLRAATRRDAVSVATRERNRSGDGRRRKQRADDLLTVQTRYSPKGPALIEEWLSLRCGGGKARHLPAKSMVKQP